MKHATLYTLGLIALSLLIVLPLPLQKDNQQIYDVQQETITKYKQLNECAFSQMENNNACLYETTK